MTSGFFIDFLSHLGSILRALFHHFCFQKYVRIGKGDFMKMSFSCTRGAHSQGFRPPRSIQQSLTKNDRNMKHFFGPLLEGLGSHSVTILGYKSHLKIHEKINAILNRFLDDFSLNFHRFFLDFPLIFHGFSIDFSSMS